MNTTPVARPRLAVICMRAALCCCALLLVALQGCATSRDSASVSPDIDIARLKSIHVLKAADDERGVNFAFTDQLRKLGYAASTGPLSSAPANVDAVLSYQPQWQWDITTYLLELRVWLRDPKTEALLASATSYHTSMARKSVEEMVSEVLSNLRGRKPVAAAGSTGPGNALVQLKPYVAQPVAGGAGAPRRADVRIGPVREARRDAVGPLIGERTTLGNISLGMIEMQPQPTQALASVLQAELAALGFGVAAEDAQPSIEAQLTRFRVSTPATPLYWDLNGVVELALVATGRSGQKHEARYQAACTDRTFVYPGSELISGVVAACLREIGTKLRNDTAVSTLLDAP